MAVFLVDSNILIYAFDHSDAAKRTRALEVLRTVRANGTGYISTQVLGEFFVTVTRKIPSPLSDADAAKAVREYIQSWVVLDVISPIVSEAVCTVSAHHLHYYDSLIWATAKLNQLTTILTEDGQHGRIIEGVRYLNPFHPDFDLQAVAGA